MFLLIIRIYTQKNTFEKLAYLFFSLKTYLLRGEAQVT